MKINCNHLSLGQPGTQHIRWISGHAFVAGNLARHIAGIGRSRPASNNCPKPQPRTSAAASRPSRPAALVSIILTLITLLATPARSATIVWTNLIDSSAVNAKVQRVTFTPISKVPQKYGNQTVLPKVVATDCDTNSAAAIKIIAGGPYTITFFPPNSYVEPVIGLVPPNDTNTYTLNDVIGFATNKNYFLWTNAYPVGLTSVTTTNTPTATITGNGTSTNPLAVTVIGGGPGVFSTMDVSGNSVLRGNLSLYGILTDAFGNPALGTAASSNAVAFTTPTQVTNIADQRIASAVTNGSPYWSTPYAHYGLGYQDSSRYPDGFNTWYYAGTGMTEASLSNVVVEMKAAGLDKLGFTTISIDDGLFTNRTAAGIPVTDLGKFPSGFPWLSTFIRSNGFKVGIYGNTTNYVGLAGGNAVYYFFGKETEGANYFLTNRVEYFKIDSPPRLHTFPFEADYVTGQPIPAMNNVWDNSILKFVTAVKAGGYPVLFNGSTAPDSAGRLGLNIPVLLNSWRASSYFTNDSLGTPVGGDITGAKKPLILWAWIDANREAYKRVTDNFFPDFDVNNGNLYSDFCRYLYVCTFFGAPYQLSGSTLFAGYHDFSADVAAPTLKQIRNRQTVPRLAYTTNGCAVWVKDNRTGGLDVLVLNKNYRAFAGGNGTTIGAYVDRWGIISHTNMWAYTGTNYCYVFDATNAVIDPLSIGLNRGAYVVTSADTGAQLYVTNAFSALVFAAAARLFTVQPVPAVPFGASASGVRSLDAEPYFHFWTTNNFSDEPIFGAYNGNPPLMGGSVRGMQLNGSSAVSYGVNGASSMTLRAGVTDYGHGVGSKLSVLVDGAVVWSSPAFVSGFTNVIIPLTPSNQIIQLYASNRCYIGEAQFNYAVASSVTNDYYYTTTTNIYGTTNTSGALYINNALTMITTPGIWYVQGVLMYRNDGSGGINSATGFPSNAVALGGKTERWNGDFASVSPQFIRRWPQDATFFQAYNTGTGVASMATFEGIIYCSGTSIWGLPITAQTLVATNPPYITTNSFIYARKIK